MSRLILVLISMSSIGAFAQKNIDTLYLDSAHRKFNDRAAAKFLRVINSYDSRADRFWATEFDGRGHKVFEGQLKHVNSPFPTGGFKFFFDNGAVAREGKVENQLDKNFLVEEHFWYPNGKRRGYLTTKRGILKLTTYYDSLGQVEVKDGNGHCRFVDYTEKTISEGQVINGEREGEWRIKDLRGNSKGREV